ncbi:helix-turn-helix domain-containing protein [Halopseudomonas bauzanensis]|nr:helix-turn-helix domain-containing protein [Halopseudomonas bauzanensis]
MTQAIQFLEESLENTRTFVVRPSLAYAEATTKGSANVPYIFAAIDVSEAPVPGASDIDSFINELVSEDSSFYDTLKSARRDLGEELYDGEITLKSLRLKKGFSQAELARKIGTSQSHIARIERRPEAIMLTTSIKLAEALSIDIGLLASLAAGTKIEAGS